MTYGTAMSDSFPSLEGLDLPASIPFTKMQGLGNDYVYVDTFACPVSNPAPLAVHVSDRHFGVGGDGLVLIGPSGVADFRMRIFNADGSEAEMCGNASRCVGKYLYEHKLTRKHELTLETGAGIRTLKLDVHRGIVSSVCVNMGFPRMAVTDIPMLAKGETFIAQEIVVDGVTWSGTAVSMGNPHLVVPVPDVAALNLPHIGPMFENHALFPKRVNTEFVQVLTPEHIRMRVWERGSGETMACGTGACASLVACATNGTTGRKAVVSLPGGDLLIEWSDGGEVFMTGPAVAVFSGEYLVPRM
jgi:diaminopimelate epimerase